MHQKLLLPAMLLSTLLFTIFFYHQSAGLNILIFEILWLVYLRSTKQVSFKSFNEKITGTGLLITSIAVVLFNSWMSISMNIISAILFVGVSIFPQVRSLINAAGLAVQNLPMAPWMAFKQFTSSDGRSTHWTARLRKNRNLLIPIFIIILFFVIYRLSNNVFDEMVTKITDQFSSWMEKTFIRFEFSIVLTVILGLFISIFLLFRWKDNNIIQHEKNATDIILRKRREPGIDKIFKTLALKSEHRAGLFLLCTLNILILIVNSIDIRYVWFGFDSTGVDFTQLVHEGTYLLIFSILISIAVVLYFFRKNLHFYPNNRWLKALSYLWIGQNCIMAISVGIRNFWYVHSYSLAYKRIGVYIFLILVLIGLCTVILKIANRKSTYFMLRTNALSVFVILCISSLFNWDVLIARYNFNHTSSSFVYLDFMSSLSDKALPYLIKSPEELNQVQIEQEEQFSYREKYMTPEQYLALIETRKTEFIERWENQSLLSWNLADARAYEALINK